MGGWGPQGAGTEEMETEGDTSSAPGVALRGVRENTAGVDIVCPP